jgi:hypothetical protein
MYGCRVPLQIQQTVDRFRRSVLVDRVSERLPRIREVAVYQRGYRVSEKLRRIGEVAEMFGTYNRILVTLTAVVRLLELTTHPLNLSHHLVPGRRSTLYHNFWRT